METKIDTVKIDEFGLCAEYAKKDGASFFLTSTLIGPSTYVSRLGRIKCENVLPTKFSFEHPFQFDDGYSREENHRWGNHFLELKIISNFDIEKIKLQCNVIDVSHTIDKMNTIDKTYIKDIIHGIYKKDCIETKLYEYEKKEYHENDGYLYYTITCPYNKIIYVKGYDLSDYLRSCDGILHGNDYDNYLKNIDKVYIKYKEKDINKN